MNKPARAASATSSTWGRYPSPDRGGAALGGGPTAWPRRPGAESERSDTLGDSVFYPIPHRYRRSSGRIGAAPQWSADNANEVAALETMNKLIWYFPTCALRVWKSDRGYSLTMVRA